MTTLVSLLRSELWVKNISPNTGISPRNGTFCTPLPPAFLMSPPSMMVSPLLTMALVLTFLLVVVGLSALGDSLSSTSSIVVSTSSVTLLLLESLGLTLSVNPMSSLE